MGHLRIKSAKLGKDVLLASDDTVAVELLESPEAVYVVDEIMAMQGISDEGLQMLNLIKEAFPGAGFCRPQIGHRR